MTDYPRDDLIRAVGPKIEFRAADSGDGNIMVGYPIVFNEPTEIDSWEGHFIERIKPGATTKTVKERGDQIKVLFNHGFDPQIGNKPLGRAAVIQEDKTGLYTETPLARTSYNEDIRALIDAEVITGMSFRFQVIQEIINDSPGVSKDNPRGLPTRDVTELKLYEFGPVTFPQYDTAAVGLRANWSELAPAQREVVARILGLPELEAAVGTSTRSNEKPPEGTSRDLLNQWRISVTIPTKD